MRILLSTIGSRGDVQPLVALALELRAVGQDVRLCVPPDFKAWIEGFDLPVVAIGPEVKKFASASPPAPPTIPSAEQRRLMIDATVATQFATIGAAADDCDVIVAASALQVAAGSIAEKRGIPYVFAAYAPTVLPSPHHAPAPLPPVPDRPALPPTDDNLELWNRNAARFNDSFGAPLNAHRAAIGLPPVSDVQRSMFTARPWLAADAALAPWPDSPEYQVFQTGAWILSDSRPLSREIEAFLNAGDPPVFFGFGSMRAAQDASKSMIHAARAVGRRAIVSSGWADLAAEDASDCLTIGEANLQTLFTRVAAVVHHGGAGTTTLAALGGAPQVVVPQMYDQHDSARRIADLGIGVAHAAGVPSAESLASALEQALRPEVGARAEAMASAVRRDGARLAAAELVSARLRSSVRSVRP